MKNARELLVRIVKITLVLSTAAILALAGMKPCFTRVHADDGDSEEAVAAVGLRIAPSFINMQGKDLAPVGLDSDMPTDSFFGWLTTTPWAKAMNGPEWAFPLVESLHFMGFALSVGTIAIVDLRLLGIAMRRQSASELATDLHVLTGIGLAVMLISGPLMFSADAVNYHHNPAFQFKMVCLLLALLFHFTLHRRAVRGMNPSLLTKLAGGVSLALWTCVLAGGRMIAFV